jgi:hypothetical protein
MKLLASRVKSFADRRSCFRIKYALPYRGIDWHGRLPQPLPLTPVTKWNTSQARVKYNSDKRRDGDTATPAKSANLWTYRSTGIPDLQIPGACGVRLPANEPSRNSFGADFEPQLGLVDFLNLVARSIKSFAHRSNSFRVECPRSHE